MVYEKECKWAIRLWAMSQIDLRRVKVPGTELPDKRFWPKLFVYLDCGKIRVLCIEYGFDA